MRVRVRHLAKHRYDAPVALGPHVVRLTPRGAAQMVHGIRVAPEPAFRLDATDSQGNRVTRLGFDGKTTALAIEARFELDTSDLVCPDSAATDPAAYLRRGVADPGVEATAARLRALAGTDPAGFAESLTAILHDAISHDASDTAPVRRPGETLARGRGSARDITALFVELSRRAGLPARFVSGYWVESADPGSRRGAHVWPEVQLPGRGWQGCDPTHGTLVSQRHVALAAAPDLAGTLPVSGSTFGSTFGAGIRVSTGVEVTIVTPD